MLCLTNSMSDFAVQCAQERADTREDPHWEAAFQLTLRYIMAYFNYICLS